VCTNQKVRKNTAGTGITVLSATHGVSLKGTSRGAPHGLVKVPFKKPHEKSMSLDRLAMLVATMPSWLPIIINQDELDLQPPGGSNFSQRALRTRAELVQALDEGTSEARKALSGTTDEHLLRPWRLLVAGRVVNEDPRRAVVRDTFTLRHLPQFPGRLGNMIRHNVGQILSVLDFT
jgi:hypothetical protein